MSVESMASQLLEDFEGDKIDLAKRVAKEAEEETHWKDKIRLYVVAAEVCAQYAEDEANLASYSSSIEEMKVRGARTFEADGIASRCVVKADSLYRKNYGIKDELTLPGRVFHKFGDVLSVEKMEMYAMVVHGWNAVNRCINAGMDIGDMRRDAERSSVSKPNPRRR